MESSGTCGVMTVVSTGAMPTVVLAIVLNPRFLTTFMGALVVPIVAVFLHLGGDGRDRLSWIVAGTVLYGATIVITGAVNVPLNKQLRGAGDVTDRSAPAVRAAFHDRWTRFNTARTVLGTAAVDRAHDRPGQADVLRSASSVSRIASSWTARRLWFIAVLRRGTHAVVPMTCPSSVVGDANAAT